MAKVELTSYAFNGGELDPGMQERVDYQKYATGAAKILNMIPRPTGGAFRRPGLRFVAEAANSDLPVRLIPFRYSAEQSYVIEASEFLARFIKDDGLVAYPSSHAKAGQAVAIVSPYAAADLARLNFTQSANTIYLAHSDYAPRLLTRGVDHHLWTFSQFNLGARPTAPNLTLSVSGNDGAKYVVTAVTAAGESGNSNSVTATKTGTISYSGGTSFLARRNWLVGRPNGSGWMPTAYNFWGMAVLPMVQYLDITAGYEFVESRSHLPGEIMYNFKRPSGETVILNDINPQGFVDECCYAADHGWPAAAMNSLVAQINAYITNYNNQIPISGKSTLKWTAVTGATKYRVFKLISLPDAAPTYYYIGETTATTFTTDPAVAADTTKGLPVFPSLFTGPGDYPGVVAIFEQRLILGRSNNKPNGLWGSVTGNFTDFSAHSPIQDDDYFHWVMDSREVNEIAWMVPMNSLLIGTAGSEAMAGGNGAPIGPKNPDLHYQSNYGCAIMPALAVGRSVVFAGRSRRVLRDFQYSLESDGFDGSALSVLVEHLFENRHIVDMCYQQEPESVLWLVMSDGALLSCTYVPKQNVVAWARHETAGKFEACASLVNVDGTDRIYFIVRRVINGVERRFIEVLDMPMVPPNDLVDSFYVDCGLTYRGTETSRLSGLNHLDGMIVQVLADGVHIKDVHVEGGAFEIPYPAKVIHVGLGFDTQLVTLDLEPIAQGAGTIRHRPRKISSVTPTLYKSVNGELAIVSKWQKTEPRWTPLRKQPAAESPARPEYFSGEVNVTPFAPEINNTTRIAIRCTAPLPLAVLGLVAQGDVGEPQ